MKVQHRPLPDQVVVVFGAASGIGRATALEAAARGAKVVASGRDELALASLARDAAPSRVVTTVAEAADPAQVQAVAELAISRSGASTRGPTWRVSARTAASRR